MLDKLKSRNKKIITRYNAGESVVDLCQAFNLSRTRIEDVIRQMTWIKLNKELDKKGTGPNFLAPTIQDLNLSTRTINKLYRYGIYTVEDLEMKMVDIELTHYLSEKLINIIKFNLQSFKNKPKVTR